MRPRINKLPEQVYYIKTGPSEYYGPYTKYPTRANKGLQGEIVSFNIQTPNIA